MFYLCHLCIPSLVRSSHVDSSETHFTEKPFPIFSLFVDYPIMHMCRDASSQEELGQPAEIISGKLYFALASVPPGTLPRGLPEGSLAYWLDQDLIYEPFCADFGPCNLAHTWRFCERVNHLLKEGASRCAPIYLLVGPHPHRRANAAALVGIYSVLYLNCLPEQAYEPLSNLEPFIGFRDASCGVPTFTLGVLDIIRGMARARAVGFINWHKGEKLDVEEYEHYEQVENGDLNWIVPGKLMAFSGPSSTPKHFGGWRTFTPEDYIDYFREKGVKAVVRLNKKMYESSRFTANGVRHHDLYFPDGTCPSEPILYRFLDIVEREPGALAVHCKAGLGRTGVLICAYMIKHHNFTAEEAMAYIRVCRPGSVIGPQQHYLIQYAPKLLREGQIMRRSISQLERRNVSLIRSSSTASSVASTSITASPKKVINITATSRTVDILKQNAQPAPNQDWGYDKFERRSESSFSEQKLKGASRNEVQTPARGSRRESTINRAAETNHIVSIPGQHVPPASPNKPAHSRGAPVYIHVEAERMKEQKSRQYGSATPPREAIRSIHSSLTSTPSGLSSRQESQTLSVVSTPVTMKTTPAPPSSTKRVLAPNGQPRKIPLAVDFDAAVDGLALEDRELHDPKSDNITREDDDWRVTSLPVQDKNYSPSNRVGAFAAAAGRGATAFMEAFRSAVGSHRKSYNRRSL